MEETTKEMEKPKPVMVVGLDASDHSFYTLDWVIDHFFVPNSIFKLVIVHAKPSPVSIGIVGGLGTMDAMPHIESDLKKTAARILEKSKQICVQKAVNDVVTEVVVGDARNVLCEAVDKYHASMLVVGSHGYGVIKRAVLGSVSNYCAQHAHCNVMIVKMPKLKH